MIFFVVVVDCVRCTPRDTSRVHCTETVFCHPLQRSRISWANTLKWYARLKVMHPSRHLSPQIWEIRLVSFMPIIFHTWTPCFACTHHFSPDLKRFEFFYVVSLNLGCKINVYWLVWTPINITTCCTQVLRTRWVWGLIWDYRLFVRNYHIRKRSCVFFKWNFIDIGLWCPNLTDMGNYNEAVLLMQKFPAPFVAGPWFFSPVVGTNILIMRSRNVHSIYCDLTLLSSVDC